MKSDMRKHLLLYAVTDRAWTGAQTLYEQVEQAIRAGVTMVQLREKQLSTEDFIREARPIVELCRAHGIPCLINDSIEVCQAVHADGVHVGQSDMNARDVRALIGNDKILGVSTQTVEQALFAQECGADYLGVGAVFPTGSKDDAEVLDRKTLMDICKAVSIPVVAIGGITKDNVRELKGTGIAGISVISAIFAQKDIQNATAELLKRTEEIL